jgi:hypothetical protein
MNYWKLLINHHHCVKYVLVLLWYIFVLHAKTKVVKKNKNHKRCKFQNYYENLSLVLPLTN